MSESEIREAIAQQEEHIKRRGSCSGVYLMSHLFEPVSLRPGVVIGQCLRCGVTETNEDYLRRMEHNA